MNKRIKFIRWIAEKCGYDEGSMLPKWLLIPAYILMPSRIPIARAVSPIKYNFESDSLQIRDIRFSCSSLVMLAKAEVGIRFEVVQKDLGTITLQFLEAEKGEEELR